MSRSFSLSTPKFFCTCSPLQKIRSSPNQDVVVTRIEASLIHALSMNDLQFVPFQISFCEAEYLNDINPVMDIEAVGNV